MTAVLSPFLSRIKQWRPRVLALLALLTTGLAASASAAAIARPSTAELVDQARAALPAGWTLTPAAAAGIPAGWSSADLTGITVQISDGRQTRAACVVPSDWIGVQTRAGAPDLVRRGTVAKVILSGNPADAGAWLERFAPLNASLASSEGSTAAYAGQYPRIEADIRTLLRRSGATRELAVASFIALGVPAEDLIRETALEARSANRLAAIRALRHFPGKDTRAALLKIIADRSRDTAADTCRIAAIDTCEALMIDSHGPALVSALQVEKDEAVAARLAQEVNRLRFAPAAPELKRWLKNAQGSAPKVACARALATLRDPGAVAEIRAALQAPAPRRAAVAPPMDASLRRELATELHRVAGAWGPEVRATRLSVTVESPDRVVVYMENMAPGALCYVLNPASSPSSWPVGLEVTLDGAPISPPGPRDAELAATWSREIPPTTAACFELPVPSASLQGDHTLTATWFGVVANEVTLRSGAAVASQPPPAS